MKKVELANADCLHGKHKAALAKEQVGRGVK